MQTDDQSTSEARQKSYLVYLLVSLVFILLVVPAIEKSSFAAGLLRLGITAVLLSAAVATRRRKPLLVLGIIVAGIAAPVSWMTLFVNRPTLFFFSCLLEGVFFLVMAMLIVQAVMRRHLATVHSIYGAISAYLLLGLAWAVVYWGLLHLDKDALNIPANTGRSVARESANVETAGASEVTEFSQLVYFSFVTMSTLGYGDATPRSSAAQTLTWMQSVTGQFYMAVLVAWMVGELPRLESMKREP